MRSLRLLAGAAFAITAGIGCGDAEAIGDDVPTNSEMRELVIARWDHVQEHIAECMREQGFEYHPLSFPTSGLLQPTGDDGEARLFEIVLSVEDAQQRGFGFVASLRQPEVDDTHQDRNRDYTDSLDESEFLAYTDALDGEDGCTAQSEASAESEFGSRVTELDTTVEHLSASIFGDDRFARIADEWAQCMGDRGWGDADLLGFHEYVHVEVQRRLEDAATVDEETQVVEYPPEALEAAQEFERNSAVDYVECFEPQRERYDEVLADAYERI